MTDQAQTEPVVEPKSKKKTWRAWLAGILTTIIVPLGGYLAHAYNQYVEAEKVMKEISLEERKYDLQVQEARTQNLKEYVPALLSDDGQERATAVAMLSVLHPEEAPEILEAVAGSLPEDPLDLDMMEPLPEDLLNDVEPAESYRASGGGSGYGRSEIPEAVEAEPEPTSIMEQVKTRVRKKRKKSGKPGMDAYPQQKVLKADLQQRSKAVKVSVSQRWTIVLAVFDSMEDCASARDRLKESTRVYEKEGKFYLTGGVYSSKQQADRAMITYRTLEDISSPYPVNLDAWCPQVEGSKSFKSCSSSVTR